MDTTPRRDAWRTMMVTDPALDQMLNEIAPQVLSLLAGVITGAGGTGIALAFFVNRRKHLHAKETNYIAQWLVINVFLLSLGAVVFIVTQVAFQRTGLRAELKQF